MEAPEGDPGATHGGGGMLATVRQTEKIIGDVVRMNI
jgi:hypothetical protein